MNKKIIYPQVIFIIALAVLSGCTSYMKGTMDLERNNYEAAIESFQQELSKNPDNWRARQQLGFAYLKTGRNDEAIAALQYVLGQEPGISTAFGYAPGNINRGWGKSRETHLQLIIWDWLICITASEAKPLKLGNPTKTNENRWWRTKLKNN